MSKQTFFYVSIAMLPVSLVLSGFTLSILWSWFIVTKFSLPELTIPEAIGIAIIAAYFKWSLTQQLSQLTQSDKSLEEKLYQRITGPFVRAASFISFGWIVSLFL